MVEGFQRGSKQMGVPTANLLPADVEDELEPHAKGVYFGWAQVQRAGDDAVYKAVMNYGERPTIKDGSHNTVSPRSVFAKHPHAATAARLQPGQSTVVPLCATGSLACTQCESPSCGTSSHHAGLLEAGGAKRGTIPSLDRFSAHSAIVLEQSHS